ncbi:exosome complex component MTR3 [Drosophila kikkawai]|uniref:Exosome complex component MTR3 n=1 Tax=Drosophila kikkawai TaxID=30033 RepID=A0A6P4HZH3_DROKI|nr:exosome complex component MTR3 [Drosophila kikkawai]
MLRVTQVKNSLLDGASIAEELYSTPQDGDNFFESLEKPAKEPENLAPRNTFIRAGVVTTVRGSAYMEYGNTKVLAIVSPPKELIRASARRMNMGVLNCYVNFAAFATGELESVPERERLLSSMLTKAMEPVVCRTEFLNFQLDVRVLILDDDGCLLSTAINCCGVALVESGISTYDLITASTACIYRDHVFLNPSAKMEELLWKHRTGTGTSTGSDSKDNTSTKSVQEHGLIITASLDTFEQIAQCQQCGYLSPETYMKLMDYTLAINKSLRQLVKGVLTARVREQHELDLREKAESALEDQRLAEVIERLKLRGLDEFIQSNIKEDPYVKKQ